MVFLDYFDLEEDDEDDEELFDNAN